MTKTLELNLNEKNSLLIHLHGNLKWKVDFSFLF